MRHIVLFIMLLLNIVLGYSQDKHEHMPHQKHSVYTEKGITFHIFKDGHFTYTSNKQVIEKVSADKKVYQLNTIRIKHDDTGRVQSIGDTKIEYKENRLHKINGKEVRYTTDGQIIAKTTIRKKFINAYCSLL